MRLLMDVPLEGGCTVQNMPVRVLASRGRVTLISWKDGDSVAFGIIPGLLEVCWVHDLGEVPRVRAEMLARLAVADARLCVPLLDGRVVYRRELEGLL